MTSLSRTHTPCSQSHQPGDCNSHLPADDFWTCISKPHPSHMTQTCFFCWTFRFCCPTDISNSLCLKINTLSCSSISAHSVPRELLLAAPLSVPFSKSTGIQTMPCFCYPIADSTLICRFHCAHLSKTFWFRILWWMVSRHCLLNGIHEDETIQHFTLLECEEKIHAKSIFTVIYLHIRILSWYQYFKVVEL